MKAIQASDHLVVAFPMWWGGQPALLKGFFDRTLLPGIAFKYHDKDPFWDRLLVGRSADVIITADTPRLFLRWNYGDPVIKQIKKQVLDFCGFKPVQVYYYAPVRKQKPEQINAWRQEARKRGAKIKTPK